MTVFPLLLHALIWLLQGNAIVQAAHIKTSPAHVGHASSILIKRQVENDIILALYFRPIYLDTTLRRAQGRNAFHWSLHVTPKGASGKKTNAFHAVNGEEAFNPDPKIFKYVNELIDPVRQPTLLARIQLGTQPSHVTVQDVDQMLSQVRIPNKLEDPSENCVSWALDGIRKLQEEKVIETFDIGSKFQEKVTQYGEDRYMAIFQPGIKDVNLGIGHLDLQSGNIIPPPACSGNCGPVELNETPDDSAGQPTEEEKNTSAGDTSTGEEEASQAKTEVASGELCRRNIKNCVPQEELNRETARPLTKKELLTHYERFTEHEFTRMVKQAGYEPLLQRSENPLSYERLHESVLIEKPHLVAEVRGKVTEIGGGALAVAGVFLWIKNMIDTFTTNSTKWEQIEVVTSILPFVGCATQAEENHEECEDDIVDSAMCFASDALLFTPAWPVGVALQLIRLTMSWTSEADQEYHQLRQSKILHELYIKRWEEYRANIIKGLLSSYNFRKNLESQFTSEQLAILYSASHAAGSLHAASLQAAPTIQKRLQREKSDEYHGRDELLLSICDELMKRKSRLADDVEKEISKLLREKRDEFEDNFFNKARQFLQDHIPYSFWMTLMNYRASGDSKATIGIYIATVRCSYSKGPVLSEENIRDIRQHVQGLGSPGFCT
ncbi:hypothetical protein CP532_0305 [Ophiocordyceps camponoti-leonardi (nom. inval.)]|nr:hypothetical protein CP532_0305 [Ophiocordyceps camponoti-leonardi (nom. inval.)]